MHPDTPNLDYMPWWSYVERTARGETQSKIATKIGVTGPSVGRWAKGALPDPSTAATFARQYGRPVLEAFVAAGFLTAGEAKQRPGQPHSITTFSDDELVKDISRRLHERDGSDAHAKPRQKMHEGTGVVRGHPIDQGTAPVPDLQPAQPLPDRETHP